MSCLTIIRSARQEMSVNEKKLADFILENSALLRDYSSQQLAASVGVSQSSVVKFSQKIGYRGFTDLKLAIHEAVVKLESNVSVLRAGARADGKKPDRRELLLNNKFEVLRSTAELNDSEAILEVVRAIESCNRVQIIATGHATIIARDLAYKLMILGKPALAETDAHSQISGVNTLGQGDALVVISEGGQTLALAQLTKQAKQAGVTVISLTNHHANSIAALASIRLYSVSMDNSAEVPSVTASTSQQHLVDLIFSELTQRDSHGRELLMKSQKVIDVTKVKDR